jgi:hypothetical protein
LAYLAGAGFGAAAATWVLGHLETTIVVRVVASAVDAPTAWDLRREIREALLTFLQENHPQSLPVQRVLIDQASLVDLTEAEANPPPANRKTDPAQTALPVHPNLHGD